MRRAHGPAPGPGRACARDCRMLLLVQAAPLLAILALLATGRATPLGASFVGLVLAIPAALAVGATGAGFFASEALRAAWIALQPVAMVAGGLLFHAAVAPRAAAGVTASAHRVFVTVFLAGTFAESAMGFSVGAVFALAALRGMGLAGAPAGALALLALCLVPWGALGPGTALGATLTGLPAQELSAAAAWMTAAWLPLLAPLFWWLCARAGLRVTLREGAVHLAALGAIAALLLLAHALRLPFETAGLFATGLPLLLALWLLEPPRDAAAWHGAARRLAPWLLLIGAILAARLWPNPPGVTPFAGLPGFGLGHAAVALWLVALLLLATRGHLAAGGAALRRAARPAAAMLCYVILARWLAQSGAASSLAHAGEAALGGAAPFAIAPLAYLSGVVTGSNGAANATLVVVQAALGATAGLPPWLAPALHNFAGAAGVALSFSTTALICGLLADGTRPAQLWRLLAPAALGVLLIGAAAVIFAG